MSKTVTTCWRGVHELGRPLVYEKNRAWVVYGVFNEKKRNDRSYRKLHLKPIDTKK